MLAKTEAAEQVTETFDRLGGSTPVLALVESAPGIEEAVSIARARGALRLAFGSGDHRRDTGTSADDLAMAYPRSRLVLASRIGALPGPIDGPTVSSSHPVLREQTAVTVFLGLTGKLCLDREQTSRPAARTGRLPAGHSSRRETPASRASPAIAASHADQPGRVRISSSAARTAVRSPRCEAASAA
ncbi:HpcH/HpaI aldolase/citrate lyase family protein [Geodermatophilus obscurus]|uniref:HpcH/HpaI aldolase/citrate lyase family protein n=1 Tax=Geodermatophilus obscurus TaxID=1861 RepID=A0A1M7UQ87_9ACTN|nr:HpcH/HpaI aldolase/citrate lyase family protein [Geodermatophilus obscurus]